MYKICIYILLALVTLSAPSCLKDSKTIFDKSPAERLDEAVRVNKELLESSPEGWIMHYYAGKDYSGPSYTLLMKFKDGKITVLSERVPDQAYTSDYDVVQDQGPVLTVNTYNEALHFLASAALGYPDGIQGDYEFAFISTSMDVIHLRGKKWKNDMTLTRMPKGSSWEEYMLAIVTIKDALTSSSFSFKLGDKELAEGTINTAQNRLNVTLGGKEFDTPFNFTDKGIVLHSPLVVEGKEYSTFTWDSAAKKFVSGNLSAVLFRPSGYKTQDFWYGTWSIKHEASTAPGVRRTPTLLQIEAPTSDNDKAKGLLKGTLTFQKKTYPILVPYDKAKGAIRIIMQPIVKNTPEAPAGMVLYPANISEDGKTNIHQEQSEYGITFAWDEDMGMAIATGDKTPDIGVINSFFGVAYEFQGNQRVPMVREGKLVTPIVMPKIEHMTRK